VILEEGAFKKKKKKKKNPNLPTLIL
jgi:hypothetical protein